MSQAELHVRVDEVGKLLQQLVADIKEHAGAARDAAPPGSPEWRALTDATPERWAAIGETELQKGLMSLRRSISRWVQF